MSTLKDVDAATDALLDFIAKHESNGNYNAVIGDAASQADLSVLTIEGIYRMQRDLVARGRPSSAVGRYQIIRKTLQELQTSEGLDGSELFSPALQDRLAIRLMVQRGFSQWWLDRISDEEFAHRLSLEWASLPDPENGGKSHYDGIGPNHAGYTLAEVYAALARVRSLIQKPAPPAPKPADAPIDPALIAEAMDVLARLQNAMAAYQEARR